MKKVFDRIASYLTKSPTRFFFVAAIAAFFVLWFVNAYSDPDGFNWHDVIVESHGILFDLLVFGILLSVYEALREKKDKIERLHEEIDDYRGWDEKEATYRIVGSIKRLNRLKINKIDISYCYLRDANLEKLNLQKANLEDTNLENANFEEANLEPINFISLDFDQESIIISGLKGANFRGANLKGANFKKANLNGVNLLEVMFNEVCQGLKKY